MNCQRMYNSFFSQHKSVYATRQNYTFTQKCARSNMKSMSLSIKGVQLWNSLDSSLFVCRNFHVLKKI